MQTVYKYELDEIVSLPLRANIIRVDYDYNLKPCLWAIVDTDRPHEDRYFEMFATGQAMRRLDSDHFRTYVGTVHDVNDCMWHVFEVKAKRSDAGVHTYDELKNYADLENKDFNNIKRDIDGIKQILLLTFVLGADKLMQRAAAR